MSKDDLVLLAVVGGAIIVLSTQSRKLPASGAALPAGPAARVSAGGRTTITAPGIATYVNVPGGGSSIVVDPSLYQRLLGSFFPPPVLTPSVAQPTLAPDYQAWDIITAPVDVFPSDLGGIYAT